MALWALIVTWWRRRQRMVDIEVLWPILLREAGDLDRARAAFAFHAMNDPAWLCLGEERVLAFINRLEVGDL
jgi:hypothetical protein